MMGVKKLSQVEEGKVVKIIGCEAGRGLRRRLEGLGLVPGQTVRVLKNGWGPLLIEVMGRKIGIGRGQAEKILVEEIEEA